MPAPIFRPFVKIHLEKTISKGRRKISMYYRFYLEPPTSTNRHLIVMEDLITEEILASEDFEDRKDAIEYFSNLYDSL